MPHRFKADAGPVDADLVSLPHPVPSEPSPPVAQPLPPAGFYPDRAGQPRWWDGSQWTDFAQPLPPPTQSPIGAPVDILPGEASVSGVGLASPRSLGVGGVRVVGYRQSPVGLAVLLLVGFGMLIGAYLLHGSSGNAGQTASVTGTVQSSYSDTQTTGGVACAPRVAYTVAGVAYSIQPSVATSSLCGFSAGYPMQVLYDPSDPAQAHLPEADSANLGTVLAMGLFGVVVLAFALLPYLSRRD